MRASCSSLDGALELVRIDRAWHRGHGAGTSGRSGAVDDEHAEDGAEDDDGDDRG